ncbi:hypothetical protein Cgig2_011021 [Carnegiea gigantea]|uniref:Uncharacterized protein n=1 Tax=Carnegiea gigantea TaxID=171969 RepID=A0A9Q1KEJ4_9CARY|nr:hypothetical protein Cgig2_011021 [Carnegiea gigantea]
MVINSGKGGVGKIATVNLDISLARHGFSVVALDAAVGFRSLDLLMGSAIALVMGKKIPRSSNRSKTLPSSPTHSFSSSSSSDFEFRISLSPRKSSAALCPADELFYKGQLLPLHLSPRISMVRTLLLASSSTSSSATDATATTASRDSSSSTDSTTSSAFATDLSLLAPGDPCCESSRPSSVTDEDDPLRRLNNKHRSARSSYFSLSRIFKKDPPPPRGKSDGGSAKKTTASAKEVIRRYLKKVKPLYEKLASQKQARVGGGNNGGGPARTVSGAADLERRDNIAATATGGCKSGTSTSTFSGNLKCGRIIKRRYVASCPSSMRSSPSHSGVLNRGGMPVGPGYKYGSGSSETSTMEELQNAIQGAIAHCKNSMLQQNSTSFNNNGNNKGKAAIEIV